MAGAEATEAAVWHEDVRIGLKIQGHESVVEMTHHGKSAVLDLLKPNPN